METKSSRSLKTQIPTRAPDCFSCKFFEVTWDISYPHGCKVFEIKCRNLPAMEVFISTGKHCFTFEERPGATGSAKEQDGIWA